MFARSGLGWTAARAAILTDRLGTGRIEQPVQRCVSRTDLADFLVARLLSGDYLDEATLITSA